MNNKFISDRYQLISLLGNGGSSTVYLAEHRTLKVYRAIKCISKTRSALPSPHLEASLLKNLRNPGIPIIFDIEEDDDCFFIVEEYIQGESLESIVKERHQISEEMIIDFGIQLCEILEYLHHQTPAPVVYLDLKPEHIILCDNRLKIVDFGLASYLSSHGKVFQKFATPEYAAPEQLYHAAGGIQSDIYSLGAVLYFLVFQKSLTNNPVKNLLTAPHYSNALLHVIKTATAYRERDRYQSVEQMKQQLQQLQYRRQCRQEKWQKHLYPTIAVVGSEHRVGTSHIAISLVSYLNSKGQNVWYEEKNQTNLMRKMDQTIDRFRYEQGRYTYLFFRGIPFYGEGVHMETPQTRHIVYDYGTQWEACREVSLILLIAGAHPWEWEQAITALKSLPSDVPIRILCNGGSSCEAKALSKKTNCRVHLFPKDNSPFILTKQKGKVFKKLLQEGGD